MALSRQQLDELIKSVSLTRPDELACDECLKMLAEFAEHSLGGKVGFRGPQSHRASPCDLCGVPRESTRRFSWH